MKPDETVEQLLGCKMPWGVVEAGLAKVGDGICSTSNMPRNAGKA